MTKSFEQTYYEDAIDELIKMFHMKHVPWSLAHIENNEKIALAMDLRKFDLGRCGDYERRLYEKPSSGDIDCHRRTVLPRRLS